MRYSIFALFFLARLSIAAADCEKISEVCVAPNETRVINGQSLFRDCWEYKKTYQCANSSFVSDCPTLVEKGCSQIGSVCAEYDDSGSCSMYKQSYQCPDKPETYTEKTVCTNTNYCSDGTTSCFDTTSPSDSDFAKSVVMAEIAREAGVYGINDAQSVELFKGKKNQCGIKVLGSATVNNCCQTSGMNVTLSNFNMLQSGLKMAETAGIPGSKFVYEALDSPYIALVFPVDSALNGIQGWVNCTSDEKTLSLKRGNNLCVPTGSGCSKKSLGICVERREEFCCFNSMLGKILNVQGKAQLGLPVNTCSGFSIEQFTALDFSKIDFSEFIATLVPEQLSQSKLSDKVQSTVNEKTKGYYE